MMRWALLVIGLYLMIIAGISLVLATFGVPGAWGQMGSEELTSLSVVVWVLCTTLCQAGLLVVPVRVASRRPVTKRHLLWPVLVAVLSCAAMAVGMFLALWETIHNTDLEEGHFGSLLLWTGIAVGVVWIAWAFLFGFYTGGREPKTLMRRIVRFLVAGSILELIVAVPTHIIARHRDYCCAGYLTVWGLGLGISVMLFAFGPGVLALFVRRWHSVQVPSQE